MAAITGTSGADILAASGSGDVLTGGAGNDVFVLQRTASQVSISDFGSIYFAAGIGGANETPPNPSPGVGVFTGVLNRARTDFHFVAQETGLDLGNQTPITTDNVTASHFHNGAPGVAGGIVFGFIGSPNNDADGATIIDPTTGTVTGDWFVNEGNGTTLTAQIPSLLAGQIYINFHTPVLPAGEIRGQVLPVDTGADKIDVTSLNVGDFDSLVQLMKPLGTSTLISSTFNGQVSNLVINNVPMATLTANDFIFAAANPQSFSGSSGADDLFGAGAADTIAAQEGNDRVFAGGGNDQVDAGVGNDTVMGGQGADSVLGGVGDDSIQGNAGSDTLSGGDGNDNIQAGKDNDTVFGDAGNDTISGDLGDDNLFGGAGADRFVFKAGFGHDWVIDFNFAEGDRIMLSPGTTFTVGAFQNQVTLTLSSGDVIALAGVPQSAFTNDYVVFG